MSSPGADPGHPRFSMRAMNPYPTIFSAADLGPVRISNRIVSTSHQTSLVHDHLPTDELVAYHAVRAAGGVGAIFLEATAVHPTGLLTAHTLGGFLPEIAAGYQRLAAAVHEHETALFVQLFHGGREQISAPPRPPAVAPSAIPSARFKSEPRSLTRREVRELIDGYAAAARLAREGQLDGIELSFAHGYLVAQFFSPGSNARTDRYNGDLEARLRFAREIIDAVRSAIGPEMALGVRLAADELTPGHLNAAACAEIAAALCGDGWLDFVSFALGHSATYMGSAWIAPPPPAAENAIADHLAAARAAVGSVPVIATTRIVDLDDAEEILARGGAEFVGMTRALIADPELLAKARGANQAPVVECIGCNQACIGHYHAGVPIGCVVNVRAGQETSWQRPLRVSQSRRVLVIGGGPAGVAAAIEAASWGDEVELREREPVLGGQLTLASRAPAHRELWERWQRTVTAWLAHLGVRVTLSLEVTGPEDTNGWEQIVVATGAQPYLPDLPTVPGARAISAWDAISDPSALIGPVLILDWGGDWAGLDAAEIARHAGHPVTLACAGLHLGEMLHQYQRALYLARLDTAGISILHHSEPATAGTDLVLRNVFSGRTRPLPSCGTLVLAQGRRPADALWSAFEGRSGAVRAGDVLSPRSLEEAMLEGALATYRGSRQAQPSKAESRLQHRQGQTGSVSSGR